MGAGHALLTGLMFGLFRMAGQRVEGWEAISQLSTKLITQDGYDALKQELDYLWREKRPDITQKVTWAASLGDRSENADWKEEPQACVLFCHTQ